MTASGNQPGNGGADRAAERRRRYRLGVSAEFVAAAYLMLKGYRVLARRYRTPVGEIDLIVASTRRLAFVEVKRRATLADAEAAITPRLGSRVRRAADLWLARNTRYLDRQIGFDLVFLMPRRLPVHIENGL